MPIYEYECQKCHQVTEAMQKFSDAPLTSCPACQGDLKKMISHSAFHLKGSGWYVTDYARKSSSAPEGKKDTAATAENKPAASDTASASTTASTTPAAKTE